MGYLVPFPQADFGVASPVVISLLTGLDNAGIQMDGLHMALPNFSQLTSTLQFNRFDISQRIVNGYPKVVSLPDNRGIVEALWLFACGVIGLAGVVRRGGA